ncbi:MAG: proline--tRNA ligase, partial [bacterium]|nr:proline--tRNA ligase [bacterium]
AIWENMQQVLDKKFKETGHKNVSMPMLIPENLLKKESDLIKGFAPEVAWVTEGGSKKLDERMCIRPTSETLFSDYYSTIVKSYRDLPIKYNQWCNVLRWEKETRPFLRSREFLWQEGHTIHETKEEAENETRMILDIYKNFFEEYLAIPVITGRKTEKEKFAGAEYTLTIESLMYNGIALQSGTSHYFGQKFSKAYDIKFLNRENKYEYVYQTSWGVTTRMIGALIMVHGDDNGLILPPKIAPIQVVVIPIGNAKDKAYEIYNKLKCSGIRVEIDESEKTPGYKFAEAEVNGIPLRVEVGERDLKENKITLSRRDNYEKIKVDINDDILEVVNNLLKNIQKYLFEKAKKRRDDLTFVAHNLSEVEKIINTQPGFIKAMWCGDTCCEEKMKEIKGIKSRCIIDDEKIDDCCVVCGKPAKELVIWGIQY